MTCKCGHSIKWHVGKSPGGTQKTICLAPGQCQNMQYGYKCQKFISTDVAEMHAYAQVWVECPYCGHNNDDIEEAGRYICESCKKKFRVVEDFGTHMI